jgi:hypothetical protein
VRVSQVVPSRVFPPFLTASGGDKQHAIASGSFLKLRAPGRCFRSSNQRARLEGQDRAAHRDRKILLAKYILMLTLISQLLSGSYRVRRASYRFTTIACFSALRSIYHTGVGAPSEFDSGQMFDGHREERRATLSAKGYSEGASRSILPTNTNRPTRIPSSYGNQSSNDEITVHVETHGPLSGPSVQIYSDPSSDRNPGSSGQPPPRPRN